ncbi:MAG: hypothetical protein AAF828_04860, partial [Bacteroidota bacterium]
GVGGGFALPLGIKIGFFYLKKKAAANWRTTVWDYYVSDRQRQLDQAYRLYTLALAGQPDLGAMNRLRGAANVSNVVAYRLGAAYALAGQKNIAAELVTNRKGEVAPYRERSYTFGSTTRDMAMLIESNLIMGNYDQASRIAIRLAEIVNRSRWLSTQEAAYVILSMSKLLGGNNDISKEVLINYTDPNGQQNEVGSSNALLQIELPETGGPKTISITNKGENLLFTSLIVSGQALPGEEKVQNSNLELQVSYSSMNGQPLDVKSIEAGTDFIASYTLKNPGTLGVNYREMALRSAVASGWEIVNERMDLVDGTGKESGYNYRDYRDDEVFTFFHLSQSSNKKFRLRLTAAYPGRYYLPTQVAEAMYDNEIQSGTKGQWVEVF